MSIYNPTNFQKKGGSGGGATLAQFDNLLLNYANLSGANLIGSLTGTSIDAPDIGLSTDTSFGNTSATLTGTLATAIQPNITTLANLSSIGTITTGTLNCTSMAVAGTLQATSIQGPLTGNITSSTTGTITNLSVTNPINGSVSGGQMTLLGSVVVSGTAASSYSFTNIPSTYNDLQLIYNCNAASGGNTNAYVDLTFNSDNAAHYTTVYSHSGGASWTVGNTLTNYFFISYLPTSNLIAYASSGTITIPAYTNTTFYKNMIMLGCNSANTATIAPAIFTGVWSSTAAVTSMTISERNTNNFANGSSFYLYGIS